jgi:TusA-related sulfurtransferase
MAKRRMDSLAPGDELLVLATDPEAPIDLGAWAAEDGHSLTMRELPGWTEFTVVKGS